jgi:hypothetical protein
MGRSRAKLDRAREILEIGSFWYNFGDGWQMAIDLSQVSSAEAKKIRKGSKGFCGYEWAVSSILEHKIISPPDR